MNTQVPAFLSRGAKRPLVTSGRTASGRFSVYIYCCFLTLSLAYYALRCEAFRVPSRTCTAPTTTGTTRSNTGIRIARMRTEILMSTSPREQEGSGSNQRRKQAYNATGFFENFNNDRDGSSLSKNAMGYFNAQDIDETKINENESGNSNNDNDSNSLLNAEPPSWMRDLTNSLPGGKQFKLPPMQVDDPNLLFYDVFLLVNLVVSISFWVVHRMQLEFVALAFNEGCLLSILWIVAGLYHGAFLYSAVDGHQRYQGGQAEEQAPPQVASSVWEAEKRKQQNQVETKKESWWDAPLSNGGPPAAGLLALNTFINTISLRLIVALVVAVTQHRPVFDDPLEQLIPMEVGFGLALMCVWRCIHSAFAPRGY